NRSPKVYGGFTCAAESSPNLSQATRQPVDSTGRDVGHLAIGTSGGKAEHDAHEELLCHSDERVRRPGSTGQQGGGRAAAARFARRAAQQGARRRPALGERARAGRDGPPPRAPRGFVRLSRCLSSAGRESICTSYTRRN